MATSVKGFSLTPEALAAIGKLSEARGVSASRFVNDLVIAEASRRSGAQVPEVLVDGVRFVPARGKRS